MRKIVWMMIVMASATSLAFAADKVGMDAQRQAHREEMKQVKKAMREEREKNPQPKGEGKWAKFWKNEGERSGLGSTSNSAGTFMTRMNPAPFFQQQKAQYEARKAAAVK